VKGPGLLMRVVAGLAMVQGVAHGLLLATYAPHHGPPESAVVSAMQTQFFHFGGPWSHSYWELYIGYAWMAAVSCVVESAVLWLAARWWDRVNVAPLVWLFIAANLVHAALVARFFFLTPMYFDLLIAVLLFVAAAGQRRVETVRAAMLSRGQGA
jgi:hypothetical protein